MPETIFSTHDAAVSTLTAAAVGELAVGVVVKHDTCPAAIVLTIRRGIGYDNLRPLGSLICRNAPSHFRTTGPQTNGGATLMNSLHGGAIDVVPELHDLRMRAAPFVLEDVSTSSSLNLPGSKIRQAFKPP